MQIGSSGMPSAAMMQQMQQKMFTKADADGNGGLSIDEFKSIGDQMKAQGISAPQGAPAADDIFKTLDTDGDGSLTQSELDKAPKPQQFSPQNQGILLQSQEESSTSLIDTLFSNDKKTEKKEKADSSTYNQTRDLIEKLLNNYSKTAALTEKAA